MQQKLKNYYHLANAILANAFYGFPSRKLKVIGVTGTDGKTTTTSLIYHILKSSGKKAAMISTVGAYIGEKHYDVGFHVTTPSSYKLQKYIQKVAQSNSEYLILEVTSHALDQYRAFGIHFDIGVITNITHEHLDYHKTYENYVKTKVRLIKMAKVAILNRDDMSYERITKYESIIKNKKMLTYGLTEKSNLNPIVFPFETNLIGVFNRYNCLAAIGVCRELGLNDSEIRKGIKTFTPPQGRQEIVYNKDFTVMIDFAHTPNSFEAILPGIKEQTKGRLIHVFGSASKRDESKRPLMGNASSKSSDIIILTAEDPRGEPVEKINHEIESGIKNYESWKKQEKLLSIPDRAKAIQFATNMAKKGDWVVITGKAHEKSMNMGHGEEPWDEFKVVEDALKARTS